MIAGEPPFQAETPVAIALRHIHEQPVSLAVHRPDLPPALVDLIMCLLEKLPEHRYQSAADMLKDLARIRGEVSSATMLQQESAAGTATQGGALNSHEAKTTLEPTALAETVASTPARRVARWPWAVVGVAACAGGAYWGWEGRTDTRVAAPAPAEPMPALWLEPWRDAVPTFDTALEQSRFAQTQADSRLRPAAWLAVAGRFPEDTSIVLRAYTQYLRELVLLGDAESLNTLAHALMDHRRQSDREAWQSLARMARASVAALGNDTTGVLEQFLQMPNLELLDPAVAELGIVIVSRARENRSRTADQATRLQQVYTALLGSLRLEYLSRFTADPLAPR
jgi:serine/threonine-protein kinase